VSARLATAARSTRRVKRVVVRLRIIREAPISGSSLSAATLINDHEVSLADEA
jgi:hypothetical protein